MANHISALKRMRVERRRTKINRARKTRLRHQVRAMRRLLNDKNGEGAQAALPATYSIVDRAAKWGIIKKNTAARYKARLTGRLKAVLAVSAQ